ncbi:group II intron reverse transcriptase/maturase [Paenibacillus vini]|uniref:group II intron reverse transcriptase/maturase n=1 Tax=Paenibacillus vini TaxID=1476024 RepID=UPI0025B67E02|nr:group II intron reverse transcriptase/maturase [Paenibacillus vini]MDN4067656.1 group II intron reverse transcriptase/maturase [Paenibacillus vini]
MVQQYDLPKSESELRSLLDALFNSTRQAMSEGVPPRFKGLLEIVASDTNILTAIHKVKANKGGNTPGTDGEAIQIDILEKEFPVVISRVKDLLLNYSPRPVRRVLIDKAGKKEKRPLGIPAVIDRIVQECVRNVLEPILEAQFFDHSYGFRPMRDAHMALRRIINVVEHGYHWIVEGDISKFFDNVNHNILLRKLWNMGIRDRRILMILKHMLKAGIMDEFRTNEIGTPQGGIISPLLANVYLHKMDSWITREWENKRTKIAYKNRNKKFDALHLRSNLKPVYLVRYADDWVLITKSKASAEKWRRKVSTYLNSNLKLQLSEEKTLITNIASRSIKFVGFEYKRVQQPGGKFLSKTRPNRNRLKSKVTEIRKNLRYLRKFTEKKLLLHHINVVNSQIRGVIGYYQAASYVNIELQKFAFSLERTAMYALRNWNPTRIPASQVNNLISVHSLYQTKIPAVNIDGMVVGVTRLDFAKLVKTLMKNPLETPYSFEGRKLYAYRTSKKPRLARLDEFLSINLSRLISRGYTDKLYNFEYYLNRAYALNRDKCKCRVCGEYVETYNVHIHHIRPRLPSNMVNKVGNLATVHDHCHSMIHNSEDYSSLGKLWKKILDFRVKLDTLSP